MTSFPCVPCDAVSSVPAVEVGASWSDAGPSETVMLPAIKEVKQTTNLPALDHIQLSELERPSSI